MTLAPGSSPQGTEFYDPEGLTYVGDGQFVMSEERDRQAVLFTYAAGTTLTRARHADRQARHLRANIGIEGLSLRPADRRLHRRQGNRSRRASSRPASTSPRAPRPTARRRPRTRPTCSTPRCSGCSISPTCSRCRTCRRSPGPASGQPARAEPGVGPDRQHRPPRQHLERADHSVRPRQPAAVAAQQHEGMTMDGNGVLYVVSENGGGDIDHPQLWVYAPSTVPNQAPTALVADQPGQLDRREHQHRAAAQGRRRRRSPTTGSARTS